MSSESDWRPLEIDLYFKGVEIFGKNWYEVSHLKTLWALLINLIVVIFFIFFCIVLINGGINFNL